MLNNQQKSKVKHQRLSNNNNMNQHYQFNQQNTQKQYYYYSQVWKNQILMQSDKTSSIKSREADYTIQEARISKIQEPIHQNFKIPNFDSNGD